jgi:hypothetical protein
VESRIIGAPIALDYAKLHPGYLLYGFKSLAATHKIQKVIFLD